MKVIGEEGGAYKSALKLNGVDYSEGLTIQSLI
jgi:hypothetical protein